MSQELEPVEPIQPPEDTNCSEVDVSHPEVIPRVPFTSLIPYIPNMTEPVVGFFGGINRATLYAQREKGLLCILRPYLNQAAGDYVELYCRGIQVAYHHVTQYEAENGLQIPLRIPYLRLPDGPVEDVFFRVTHNGNEEDTDHLRLKVDTFEPGGRDPIASTLPNENLPKPIFPNGIINNGVTETDAQNGVEVTFNKYPIDDSLPTGHHRARRDKIRLSIGGVIEEFSITEGEEESTGPIKRKIYYSTWEKVGSGQHVCEYEVVDEVGNYSLGWSPMQLLSVALKGAPGRLKKPYIEDAIDDAYGDSELDLDELNGQDTTIVVQVRDEDFFRNDLIRVQAEGRTQDSVIITKYYEHEVLSITRDARIPLPFDDLAPLIKGRLNLRYERIRSGEVPKTSDVAVVYIIGQGSGIGLAPPLVLEAPDGNLPADLLTVTVYINAYTGQQRSDGVTLLLSGTYANGAGYYREIGPRPANQGPITIRLTNGPNGDIAKLEGGTLDIAYRVEPEKGAKRESEATHLEVGDNVASLPAPFIEEAPPPDFIFNPDESRYGATIVVHRNPAFTLNSIVNLHFNGSGPNGTVEIPFKITSNWVNKDLYFDIDRTTILRSLNRTATIYYTLKKDYERLRFSHAVIMKIGAPLSLPVPVVLEATQLTADRSTINPVHVLTPPVFTIRIAYQMLSDDQITAYFEGTQGPGTPIIPSQLGNPAQGFVDFIVNHKAIGANLGRSCFVRYKVVRAGGTTDSKVLTLDVQSLPSALLDVVSVPEAVGGAIDANSYNSVLVDIKYPFNDKDQGFWIDLIGDRNYELRKGKAVTPEEFANKRIVEAIPSDYLSSLPNESNLRIEARVSLNGLGSKDSAIPLVVPTYRIKKAVGVIAHIDVGGTPCRLVASPDGRRVYVTNETSHSVSVIDTNTNKVIHTITGGLNRPHAIAIHPDGGTLYVSNLAARTVSVINTTSYAIINTMTGFNTPYAMTLNKLGTRLYITCYSDHNLYTHDTSTGARLFTIGGCYYASSATFNTSYSRLYAGMYTGIQLVEPVSNTLLTTISGFSYPRDASYSPHNSVSAPRLYVANTSANNVIIVNAGSNIIHKTLTGFSAPYGIAVNPVIEQAYVTDFNNNLLKIIDTVTETVIDAIPGFNKPFGLAVLPNGSKVYVANQSGHTVTVVAT